MPSPPFLVTIEVDAAKTDDPSQGANPLPPWSTSEGGPIRMNHEKQALLIHTVHIKKKDQIPARDKCHPGPGFSGMIWRADIPLE